MTLIAVILGYILGVAPSIYKEVKEIIMLKQENQKQKKEGTTTEQIVDEWLNGVKERNNTEVNQEDIYKEYVTGEITKGE